MTYASDQLSAGALNSTGPSQIAAKAAFLPVDSFSPSAGTQGLPTGQNAPVSQILTLRQP